MAQARNSEAEVTHMSLPTLLKTRWNRPSRGLPEGPSSLRFEVRPPTLRQAPDSVLGRFWFWLAAPEPQRASLPVSRLPGVRADFRAALLDLPEDSATELLRRIELSHSLRELWHLRADVYRVVAVARSQSEAEARLTALNRHFPSRTPRSAFAPL
jgi:hypothetical protein